MIICPKCGHRNPDGTRWCVCGQYLEWTEPAAAKGQASVLTVRLAPSDVAVQPGGEATCEARVRNDGTIVDESILEVTGEAAAWTAVEPARLSLMPGQELTAAVRFRPPRSPAVRAGRMPFGVRVRSSVAGSGDVDEKAGSVTVGAFTQIGTILVPETSEGVDAAEHTITVRNEGNVAVEVNLSVGDPEGILAFDVQPPKHVVEPGASAISRLRVWRRQGVSRPGQRLPFQLVAEPGGMKQVMVGGAFRQLPELAPAPRKGGRRWTWPLAVAGALALVVSAVAFATGGGLSRLGFTQQSPAPSATAPPVTPPPATSPPATATPTPPPPSPARIEAESQTFDSNVRPLVSRQSDCCGAHWSNGQQLWLRANGPGQYVTVLFRVSQAGTYRVDVRLTRAPDYGTYSLELDGQTLVAAYQGYTSGTVGSTVATDIVPLAAQAQLSAGTHNFTVRVTGKSSLSAGYFAGIDYIDLTPR